jgi:hypothetical protein
MQQEEFQRVRQLERTRRRVRQLRLTLPEQEAAAARIDLAIRSPAAETAAVRDEVAGLRDEVVGLRADNAVLAQAIQTLASRPIAAPPAPSPPKPKRRRKPFRRTAVVAALREVHPDQFPPDFPDEAANLPPALKRWDTAALEKALTKAKQPPRIGRTTMHEMKTIDVEQWWVKPKGTNGPTGQ